MNLELKNIWPAKKPTTQPFMHGWFGKGNQKILAQLINKHKPKVFVELGSWYGSSAKFILQRLSKNSHLYCIDRWDNNFIKQMWASRGEDYKKIVPFIDEHPLYETFLANFWHQRKRITPIQADTIDGLNQLKALGITPDIVYIDAGHQYETVKKELLCIRKLFPNAILCGDDWRWPSVRRAVIEHAEKHGYQIANVENCWYYA